MSHTIIYSADELRELISSLSPLVTSHPLQAPLSAPQTTERASLVTQLPDRENLQAMLNKPRISAVLPIREEKRAEDAADRAQKLDRLIVSTETSIIMANHSVKSLKAHYSLNHSCERWQVIDDFGKLAATTDTFKDFPEICRTICSELVTNAFYNAPRDANGRPLQADRRRDVTLQKPVDVSFGEDESHLWLKVRDPFGTFSREALLNSLLKSSDGTDLSVNMGEGGAGIGLYMVFRWAAQLMFEFRPNTETCVMVKLLKTKRYKIFDGQRAILEIVTHGQ
jgi:hypothetical protein